MSDKTRFLARFGTREHALDAIHNSDDHDIIASGLMNHHIKMHEVQTMMDTHWPHDPKKDKITRMARYVVNQIKYGALPEKDDQ